MTEGNKDHIEFLESFAALDDPRQQAKVMYPLQEILLLCLCAVLSGADCWVEVALYGQQRLAFLRRFLPFKQGVPSHDQLGIGYASGIRRYGTVERAWCTRNGRAALPRTLPSWRVASTVGATHHTASPCKRSWLAAAGSV